MRDEGAEGYLFHCFTTAGFQTTGTAEITPTGFSSRETVMGHDTIRAVVAQATPDAMPDSTPDAGTITVTATYVGPAPFSQAAQETLHATTRPEGRYRRADSSGTVQGRFSPLIISATARPACSPSS